MSTDCLAGRLSVAVSLVAGVIFGHAVSAQSLARMPQHPEAYEVVNRVLTFEKEETVHLSAAKDDGIAWLVGQTFTQGRITVEVRGLDVMQRSFVGVAFHGRSRNSFDTVYTRPFNFNAADPEKQSHSLQYMSLPDNDWEVLRKKSPGKYEAVITAPPAAEAWVRLTLEIESQRLRVFVNDASEPTLTVDLLNDRLNGRVGLWVGNNSEGWFRNLTIRPMS